MAPEVLSISAVDKHKRVGVEDGKRADVYSFAMVMFEVRSLVIFRFDSEFKHLTTYLRY
jgi:hypothetical protein